MRFSIAFWVAGMDDISKHQILQLFNFSLGSLPVRYLGVPLITFKLMLCDCSPLIDKTEARIKSWNNNVLSFAGRLQLIQSVLSSI